MRSSDTPDTNVTMSFKPSLSSNCGRTDPSRCLPMISSSTSRSVRALAMASSSGRSPFRGTSALAVVITRQRAFSTWARGRKRS